MFQIKLVNKISYKVNISKINLKLLKLQELDQKARKINITKKL